MQEKNTAVATQKPFSLVMQEDKIKQMINNTLGDPKRASRFTASLTSVVATNPTLKECEAGTLISSALVGEALELPMSPQLGYFYMVPMKERKWNPLTKEREVVRTVATFVLGYKGYIQLAIRSGYYHRINVIPIKKGEFISWDPLDEVLQVKLIQDEVERENAETVGYYAFFEYLNGFKKCMYMNYNRMMIHANKYSEAFNAEDYTKLKEGKIDKKDMWKYSSFWYADFDGMAMKTMLRQLLSKWGLMSVEMVKAFESDSSFEDADGNRIYPDNPNTVIQELQNVKAEVRMETGNTPIPPTQEEIDKAREKAMENPDTIEMV